MNEVARRYDRISRYYDTFESIVESNLFSKWRAMLWRYPRGDVLEVGVGTGNIGGLCVFAVQTAVSIEADTHSYVAFQLARIGKLGNNV